MIAVFGGSFNPIHKGHLHAARLVLSSGLCSEVWFVPCYRHVFKPELISFDHRAEMIKLCIKGEKRFKLCLIEKELAANRKKPNTTIETIRELKRRNPKKDFCWVIGSDLLPELPRWYKFNDLLQETSFVVVPIKGIKLRKDVLRKIKATVLESEVDFISSKHIRGEIRNGKSAKQFLEPSVWEYIESNLLYVSEFSEKVYSIVRKVPRGRVATYKGIASMIGSKAYRVVGIALKKNPFESVPCHRIVKSDGSLDGYRFGPEAKAKKLRNEGIKVVSGKISCFECVNIGAKELI